jgi:signal transduction histidine kinase
MESACRGELFAGVERRRRTKAGVWVDIAIWNEVLRDREGAVKGILSIIADVTDKRRLEEQLRQALKMEAVGRLAGGVAHDFNNILTVITGYGQMLAERIPEDDDMRADLEEILRAADHAGALTSQLLVFSRHKVSNPQVVCLSEIVCRLEKMLRRMIGEDVELFTQTKPDLGKVRADPAQIEQVVLNLAVNARDAMPKGGRLTIEMENVELDQTYARRHIGVNPGRYAMIAVSDTGTGMDAETRIRLFEPFFTTKEKGKGTGLGLSTVYGIVKQCGGEIWVYSEVGLGTTFKIYLPLVAGPEPAEAGPPAIEPIAGGAETVLLVEDEAVVRKLVRNILTEQGYSVLESSDPHDALRVCQQHPETIDLLLTDVVMPHMSGRDLADRALALRPGMRVLYMSGYTDSVIVHHGLAGAGAPFLQKPFTPASLVRKVRQILDE